MSQIPTSVTERLLEFPLRRSQRVQPCPDRSLRDGRERDALALRDRATGAPPPTVPHRLGIARAHRADELVPTQQEGVHEPPPRADASILGADPRGSSPPAASPADATISRTRSIASRAAHQAGPSCSKGARYSSYVSGPQPIPKRTSTLPAERQPDDSVASSVDRGCCTAPETRPRSSAPAAARRRVGRSPASSASRRALEVFAVGVSLDRTTSPSTARYPTLPRSPISEG